MAKLTFVLEDGQEVVVPLKEHITLGRDEDNDIMVDDEGISPRHAEIVQNADGSLQVFDLKSTTGTFVNGERQLSCTLLHGDTIAFGPLVGTLDLEHPATSPPVEDTPIAPAVSKPAPPAPVPEPEAPASEAPAPEAPEPAPPSPPPAPVLPDNALVEAVAHLEAEKSRLKSEVDTAEKELRDWQQRAEKERALHLARVESLQAEEEKLAPAKAAVQQAEAAHREWLETISSLTSQHDDKTAALERLNAQHYEKSTEVQRLTATAAEAQQQIEDLAVQKEEAAARLKQVRDECEQDEALLNSLRQQIIEHEKRIVEEVAKHASLNTATIALSAKYQREEASVKDLESLLMSLEQKGAAAEGSLQRLQDDLASCEKKLATRTSELAACEKSIAASSAELAAETKRIADARAQRAELEQLNLDLTATKQQLVDARQRLAAVEQRYRDAQSNDSHGGSQMAPPRRNSAQEEAPKAAVATNGLHAELPGQIEAARRELAELQARIASLRHSPSGAEVESAQDSSSISPPVIVQVETIKLAPIPIKSERTRGPGTKKAAARN
jgi:predicted  nucleic acid-binding Zn-ribbon protein